MRLRSETAESPRDMIVRSFRLRADTINEAERSVEAVLCTESPTTVFDMRTWEPVDEVLRMDGWEPVDQVPLFDSHPQLSSNPNVEDDLRGSVRNIQVSGDKQTGKLYFAADKSSLNVWGKVRDKHARDLSIGAIPLEQTEIAPGETKLVGGKSYTAGPRKLFITTKWKVGETSVTPRGADPRAKIRQAPSAPPLLKEPTMNERLRAYLESIGLAKDASEAKANEFLATLRGDQLAEGERLRSPVATPAAITQTTVAAAPVVTSQAPNLDAVRAEAAAAERRRIDGLTDLAGNDVPRELLRSAIDNGWDENRASREFLGAIRTGRPGAVSAGPAIHSRGHETDCTLRSLQIGFMHRLGTRVIDPNASERVRAEQEREAEMGDRYRYLSMIDICREAVRLDRRTASHNPDELVREAVSGASLSAIFTTNVNARLLESYRGITDTTTAGWCREADVANFKTNERFSLGKTGDLEKLPRGGKATHATIDDMVETYKIARYAKQLILDEQDIIDDSYGALQTMPNEMGEASGRLRPALVYAILLLNPLLEDGLPIFHANHNNLVSGGPSALGVDALAAAITAMAKQTLDGVTLNINSKFIIIPQDLRWTTQTMLRAGEIRNTTASTKYPTYNPVQVSETDLMMVRDNRVGVAGVVDPSSNVAVAGSATNWFMSAAAMEAKTIEVGYRVGTGRQPQVRPFILTQGQWGVGWDISMDIGAKALDFRGLYKSVGQ